MTNFNAFDRKKARHINKARLEHLASLGLPLRGKRVLEPGSGIGLLTGFFEDMGCAVYSTEGRKENVNENLRRHPWRKGKVGLVDLMVSGSHDHLGTFDVVFCYGTLYHVPDPKLVLRDLAHVCNSIFLLESCVHPNDNGKMNPRRESKGINQGIHKMGCRPARDWLMNELEELFGYSYLTVTQPDHPAFPLEWPAQRLKGSVRSIFVASREPLILLSLSGSLLKKQRKFGESLSD